MRPQHGCLLQCKWGRHVQSLLFGVCRKFRKRLIFWGGSTISSRKFILLYTSRLTTQVDRQPMFSLHEASDFTDVEFKREGYTTLMELTDVQEAEEAEKQETNGGTRPCYCCHVC
ncbi:hypothetical protein QYE76_048474 [Lolium multiflorum]|uniref:Uncharacterized protein n=1 Tax=Lolium multiflorum TaxID=4521 RepID=A0AAD8SM89_LOLMU|nr:hypothetical protein QYE76_048474 [Lolium multiflorum]